ncbi:hypothetical protein H2203_001010 [Taxawa tesnikishii (nom. ined.)]|nr:hypothetical protein H2203_001010 [Dothideales sp. JES 119]
MRQIACFIALRYERSDDLKPSDALYSKQLALKAEYRLARHLAESTHNTNHACLLVATLLIYYTQFLAVSPASQFLLVLLEHLQQCLKPRRDDLLDAMPLNNALWVLFAGAACAESRPFIRQFFMSVMRQILRDTDADARSWVMIRPRLQRLFWLETFMEKAYPGLLREAVQKLPLCYTGRHHTGPQSVPTIRVSGATEERGDKTICKKTTSIKDVPVDLAYNSWRLHTLGLATKQDPNPITMTKPKSEEPGEETEENLRDTEVVSKERE